MVVVKKCEPEISYILTVLFNKCLEESCFPDYWKVSSVVPVFKNVGEKSMSKNNSPVSLLSVILKDFEKLINNSLVIHLKKCGFSFWFSVWFQSSQLTAGLESVVSDKIVSIFNRLWATWAVAFAITQAFIRVRHGGLLHKQLLVRYLALFYLFSVIDSFNWSSMASLYKNIRWILVFLKARFYTIPAIHQQPSWVCYL